MLVVLGEEEYGTSEEVIFAEGKGGHMVAVKELLFYFQPLSANTDTLEILI
jgi:hypothetical protein